MPQEMVKTTLRLPRKLFKDVKRFALENDKTVTEVTEEAFTEYLKIHSASET